MHIQVELVTKNYTQVNTLRIQTRMMFCFIVTMQLLDCLEETIRAYCLRADATIKVLLSRVFIQLFHIKEPSIAEIAFWMTVYAFHDTLGSSHVHLQLKQQDYLIEE